MKIVLLFCFLLFGCSPARHLPGAGPEGLGKSSRNDFAAVKRLVFEPYCVGCHSQFRSYNSVIREISAIGETVKAGRMPKNAVLGEDLKALLEYWIRNGAPNEPGSIKEPGDVLRPVTSSIFDNILIPKCLVCHNPQGQAKFLDLSSRQAIFSARNRTFGAGIHLIDFENVEMSYLIQVVQDPAEPMPPVWSKIPLLTEGELRVLKDWISLGLP